ncbi:MAG: nucleotidyltransferase domain-containing protein [Gallionella sp.]
MRLSDAQRTIIRSSVAQNFGVNAVVRLFGSRTDDSKRGGDIDLLIETEQNDVAQLLLAEIALISQLHQQLGEQKIDVLLDYPTRLTRSEIFSIARKTGVVL